MIDETLNETNPLSDFSDQLRAVEALLFASSDPIDEKTLIEILPENADICLLYTSPSPRDPH